jgi:myo-inositol 2-dehydrogenase/D-chiro-inositol 1-dehydrogenase
MKDRLRVGVIGTGRIGRLHAQNLAFRVPGAQLVAVSDVLIDAAERLAGELDVPVAYEDYRRITDDPDIEAVIICSSTNTHASIIEESAAAGKHIFCEKPIALELPSIDRALAAVEKAGVKLQIGFNRRFDPNFRRAREIVASGKIGDPHMLRITSRDPQPPPLEYVRVSGGIFLDMSIHDFDMARFMIDSEVDEIFAAAGVLVDPAIGEAGDYDTAVTILRYENGVIGNIDNSRKAVYGYDQRVEVFGSDGMVAVANPRSDTIQVSGAQDISTSLPLFFFVERYTESYVAEMNAFIECVLEDQAPPVSGLDGRVPVIMGYAAKKSCAENRPVKLAEIG